MSIRWYSPFITLLAAVTFPLISWGNVIGSDAQNFSPTVDGLDYVSVHSSKTLEPWIINLGLFINYAQNTFPAFEGSGSPPSQSLLDKNDSLTSLDFNGAIGISEKLQVGLSLPYILSQSIEDSDNLGQFTGSGTSEIRPSIKYNLSNLGPFGNAIALSANFNLIENNPYLGSDPGPTINTEYILDSHWGRWNWALNIGHRWRNPGDELNSSGIDPLPNQWIYSFGISRLLSNIKLKTIFEIYGSQPSKSTSNLSDRQNSSLELLGGVKYVTSKNLSLHVGGSTQLEKGTSTPDWRIYSGLNYTFGPIQRANKYIIERRLKKKILLSLPLLEFQFNSHKVTEKSKPSLQQLIGRIKVYKKISSIVVEGHTDSLGSDTYNQQLSQKRADAIAKTIAETHKHLQSKVKSIGYGESKPIANNGNYQGRQKNRRVEIKINQ